MGTDRFLPADERGLWFEFGILGVGRDRLGAPSAYGSLERHGDHLGCELLWGKSLDPVRLLRVLVMTQGFIWPLSSGIRPLASTHEIHRPTARYRNLNSFLRYLPPRLRDKYVGSWRHRTRCRGRHFNHCPARQREVIFAAEHAEKRLAWDFWHLASGGTLSPRTV
jgi:hypothetical protein